ncbi:thrombospondin type 3 repeat-containing protein [Ramlibacter alkalitolerans]|uniref:thrombospondin type 3 repeat-containing protein n=1 Tax=Ramlibacter alkalitolerans TaxID=2039631 RepID=UPI002ED472F2
MKSLLLLPAAAALAALAGCATYGDPYYGYGPGVSATAVYQSGPGYGYYGGTYPSYPVYQGVPARGLRDRDGDGIPNRVDMDRDGDGIPNTYDRRPNNPSRR